MKQTKEVTQDLVDWAAGLVNLDDNKYSFPAEYKDKGLPDVACELVRVRVRQDADDPGWRVESVEQKRLRLYEVEIIFMVPPDPPQEATEALTDYIDTVTVNLENNGLKDKYHLVDANYTANFRPPFIEFDDGTRGRQVTLQLTVGERI